MINSPQSPQKSQQCHDQQGASTTASGHDTIMGSQEGIALGLAIGMGAMLWVLDGAASFFYWLLEEALIYLFKGAMLSLLLVSAGWLKFPGPSIEGLVKIPPAISSLVFYHKSSSNASVECMEN